MISKLEVSLHILGVILEKVQSHTFQMFNITRTASVTYWPKDQLSPVMYLIRYKNNKNGLNL